MDETPENEIIELKKQLKEIAVQNRDAVTNQRYELCTKLRNQERAIKDRIAILENGGLFDV